MSALLSASFTTITAFGADSTEPSIIIRHSEDKTYYEYSVNGKLQEIKVVPKVGATYYLVPNEHDETDLQRQSQSKIVVPKWVIFSW